VTNLAEARARAQALLAATEYFAALGREQLSAESRVMARFVLEIADELDAERSARIAIQAARDEAVEILARRAGSSTPRGSCAGRSNG
jgi:hypothetical protein